jgi:hypothetical protein
MPKKIQLMYMKSFDYEYASIYDMVISNIICKIWILCLDIKRIFAVIKCNYYLLFA